MTTGWAIVVCLALIVLPVAFFVMGVVTGEALGRESTKTEQMRLIEAERQMHDLTRQAFISMAEATERHQRIHPAQRPQLPSARR